MDLIANDGIEGNRETNCLLLGDFILKCRTVPPYMTALPSLRYSSPEKHNQVTLWPEQMTPQCIWLVYERHVTQQKVI